MLSISLAVALLASLVLSYEDEKTDRYLKDMCYPIIWANNGQTTEDPFALMSKSPFPCEQVVYLATYCFSNGTTEIDFLAEQQCLCGGNYFEALRGCYDCFYTHGLSDAQNPVDKVLRDLTSASSAECSATPITIPYTNLYPTEDWRTSSDVATLTSDRFPNDTAISNYWTGATAPIMGQITGSATGRLTSYTNSYLARYTPTGTTGAAPTSGGGASSTTPASPSSTNGAAEVKVAGGLLAVVIGAMAAL
ncbi:hypothetical protein O988_05659 [Pseudogymnoascus sp. VKM F-3808]|nr:hypothetical protein O988_05659 [Pseudogymnoascus sp. VKM F-3808]